MTDLRIVFAGSPAAAVPSLRAIASSRHDIAAVVTRADSLRGRNRVLSPTTVAEAAHALGLAIIKTNRLTESVTDEVTALRPDLGVIVAYGALLRDPLLTIPRLGWINLHFSLLPRWRGAAPVQRSIIAGDDVTGASVFQLTAALDDGDLFGQVTQPIGAHQTAGQLLASLADGGAELLVRVIDAIADGSARAEPQRGDASSAPKLTLADGRIRWTRDARTVDAQIRGVTPEPGAFTTVDLSRLKVLDAVIAREVPRRSPGVVWGENRRVLVGTATDPIELITVQPAGKRAMPAADWWRGRADRDGTVAE